MNQTKCIFFIGTLVSLILLSPSTILYANAQDEEHEDEPDVQHIQIDDESEVQHVHVHEDHKDHEEHDELELFISVQKIVLSKSVGVFSSDESDFEFHLKNFNDVDITGIKLVLSDFTIDEETRFSDSALFIKKQDITMKPSGPLNLEKNEEKQIELSISDQVKKEGTYKGELTVTGEDIKPTTIEVTLKVHENITELLVVTLWGAFASGGFGLYLAYLEKKEKFERSINDDSTIISQINGHIRNLNLFKGTIDEKGWKNVDKAYRQKRESIEKYRDKLELNSEAEAVTWFENTANQLLPKYFDEPHHEKDNPHLAEIMDVKYIMQNNPEKEIKDKLKELTEEQIKELELKKKQEGLTPEEKKELKDKLKELTEEQIKELELKKKQEGLTPEEEKDLNDLENELKKLNKAEVDLQVLKDQLKKLADQAESELSGSKTESKINDLALKGYICQEIANELVPILGKKIHRAIVSIKIGQLGLHKKHHHKWEDRIKKYDNKKKILWNKKLVEEVKKVKKWFYFASTMLVALPTTMFVTNKFVQDPLWDMVIAFSIGFAIYRAQDIQKAFTKEVKTPKVADKNSTPVAKDKHNH